MYHWKQALLKGKTPRRRRCWAIHRGRAHERNADATVVSVDVDDGLDGGELEEHDVEVNGALVELRPFIGPRESIVSNQCCAPVKQANTHFPWSTKPKFDLAGCDQM